MLVLSFLSIDEAYAFLRRNRFKRWTFSKPEHDPIYTDGLLTATLKYRADQGYTIEI